MKSSLRCTGDFNRHVEQLAIEIAVTCMNIRIISAGAGSGKTYRLTQEMVNLLEGKK